MNEYSGPGISRPADSMLLAVYDVHARGMGTYVRTCHLGDVRTNKLINKAVSSSLLLSEMG